MRSTTGLSRAARRAFVMAIAATTGLAFVPGSLLLADDAADAKQYQDVVSKAITFLTSRQTADGSFSPQMGIGPTAMATSALLMHGRTAKDPVVAKALAFLEKSAQPDGGIYKANGRLPNYETCVAVVCFEKANTDGKYDELLKKADKYLRGNQIDESDDKTKTDIDYGGAGYGGPSRPDLSNTSYLIDALKATGAKDNDEAIQRALVFVSRCQNLESEYNTTPFAAKVNDGGFYYTPVISQQDLSREADAAGGLRSYGSMSYHGLKSLVYAGLKKDDPRVVAATKWIGKNYDVTKNPGMGDAGLFYYYNTFAKGLAAAELDAVEDASGKKHNWRADLVKELAKRQQENGSWVNANNRWMESDPVLCTSFALLALGYSAQKAK